MRAALASGALDRGAERAGEGPEVAAAPDEAWLRRQERRRLRRSAWRVVAGDFSWRGHEGDGIFGVDPALHRMPLKTDVFLCHA